MKPPRLGTLLFRIALDNILAALSDEYLPLVMELLRKGILKTES